MAPFASNANFASVIAAFGGRHPDPEASALLSWASSCVDSLQYLADLDAVYDATRHLPGAPSADTIDVTHARWATGTCITALDLAAACLARALGAYVGSREFDIGMFRPPLTSKVAKTVAAAMPPVAMTWICNVLADARFAQITEARNSLTHRRLIRHLYEGGNPHNPRLDLQIGPSRIPVRTLIETSRDLASDELVALISILPHL